MPEISLKEFGENLLLALAGFFYLAGVIIGIGRFYLDLHSAEQDFLLKIALSCVTLGFCVLGVYVFKNSSPRDSCEKCE